MSQYIYRDGPNWIAVETGMPEQSTRFGCGATKRAALADMSDTNLQSVGRDGGLAMALHWGYRQGACSHPDEFVEVEVAS